MPLIKVASGSLGQGLNAGVRHGPGQETGQAIPAGSSSCRATARRPRAASGRRPIAPPATSWTTWRSSSTPTAWASRRPTRHGHDLAAYERKFPAFGWETAVVDGHDVQELAGCPGQGRRRRQAAGRHRQDLQGQGRFLHRGQGGLARQAPERKGTAGGPGRDRHGRNHPAVEILAPSRPSFTFHDYPVQ